MRCFVVAEFLLTSASRGPSAIAEPLVLFAMAFENGLDDRKVVFMAMIQLGLRRLQVCRAFVRDLGDYYANRSEFTKKLQCYQ